MSATSPARAGATGSFRPAIISRTDGIRRFDTSSPHALRATSKRVRKPHPRRAAARDAPEERAHAASATILVVILWAAGRAHDLMSTLCAGSRLGFGPRPF